MRLSIEINLGNEAMQYGNQVADALHRSFGRHAVETHGAWQPLRVSDEGLIRDINGNTVGRWDVLASGSPLDGVEEPDDMYDGLGDQAHHGPDGYRYVGEEG